MELKKSPKADLENKRTYFLEIGYILALAFAIGMFSLSQKERIVEIQEQEIIVVETEMTEITIQDDKRPPAPFKTQAVAISEIINLVDDDEVIEETSMLDLDVTQLASNVQDYGGNYMGEGAVDDVPVVFAEKMPSFMGGNIETFRAWVGKNVKYPPAALDNGTQGSITIRFVVERDGSVSRAEVYGRRGDKTLEQEALRVINSSPKWSPGLNNGKPVRVYIVIPVVFVLE